MDKFVDNFLNELVDPFMDNIVDNFADNLVYNVVSGTVLWTILWTVFEKISWTIFGTYHKRFGQQFLEKFHEQFCRQSWEQFLCFLPFFHHGFWLVLLWLESSPPWPRNSPRILIRQVQTWFFCSTVTFPCPEKGEICFYQNNERAFAQSNIKEETV